MFWPILIGLAVVTIASLLVELRGIRTTVRLSFKGDIKRESAFLAQYGQSVATPLAGWLAAIAHGNNWRVFMVVCAPVMVCSIVCSVLKRSLGRMRPDRERAGAFTGFSWKHSNSRESFPSSHSACAFALSATLVHVWPQAAIVFWPLAFITASLRYLMAAHFPSDIAAGSMLGLLIGHIGVNQLAATLGV